ncbi:MAG: glycosyltransferase family 2 protein [Candidatus Rokuibacteriota bacterium]|nr:MAG: glycosyltransferase family 2 protein [Candidatus Rokubacteria bacterium]PYN21377.1 MAG: glycosyltransferase family 2 protein [Candidatus Rokubacteria bacterium]
MTPRPRLSVVVVTRDEEERLRACLESVAWADEIVVVDAESEDKTVTIAREFTDRVVVRPWPGYAAQKNAALDLATGDWALSLDADEVVSPELRSEIAGVLASDGPADGYAVPRRNIFWGRWVRHGGLYPDWQVRLFRRGRGRFVPRAVHESVSVDGRVERLVGHLEHRSYRDVSDFLARADRYSTLAADEAVAQGRGARVGDLLLRPLGRFLAMYVVGRGFLDGWRGFLLATLYAYYVLIRAAKIWERTKG